MNTPTPIGYLCRHRAHVADATRVFGEGHDTGYLWRYTHGTQELELMEQCEPLEVVRVYSHAGIPAAAQLDAVEAERNALRAAQAAAPLWRDLQVGEPLLPGDRYADAHGWTVIDDEQHRVMTAGGRAFVHSANSKPTQRRVVAA
jgi:hypothetical protein